MVNLSVCADRLCGPSEFRAEKFDDIVAISQRFSGFNVKELVLHRPHDAELLPEVSIVKVQDYKCITSTPLKLSAKTCLWQHL